MTAAAKSFDIEWPSLERRLRAFLACRGVPIDDRDDIVQETGIRLMKMWADVDWHRSVWNLSTTIATRLWYDDLRRARKHQLVEETPEIASSEDPENSVIARLELSTVGSALAKLSPRYRSVLLSELVEMPSPKIRPATLNVVRLRARRRLSAILGRALAPVGLASRRVRDRLVGIWWHNSRGPEKLNILAGSGVNVIAALVVVAGGGALSQSVPTEPARPQRLPGLVTNGVMGPEAQDVMFGRAERRWSNRTAATATDSRSDLGRGWRDVRNEYDDAVDSYHEVVDNAQGQYGRTRRSATKHRDAYKDAWGDAREQWQDARDVGLP